MPTLAFRKVRACSFQLQALSFKVSMLKEDDSRYEGADSAKVRVERKADREEKSPMPAMAGKSSALNRPPNRSTLGSALGRRSEPALDSDARARVQAVQCDVLKAGAMPCAKVCPIDENLTALQR